MADELTPPPPPPPMPDIGLPEFSYPNGKPLDVRLLEWLFGANKKPR